MRPWCVREHARARSKLPSGIEEEYALNMRCASSNVQMYGLKRFAPFETAFRFVKDRVGAWAQKLSDDGTGELRAMTYLFPMPQQTAHIFGTFTPTPGIACNCNARTRPPSVTCYLITTRGNASVLGASQSSTRCSMIWGFSVDA